ncbi:MAG: polysaccharide deacetylase family protein [Candidatus Eremiobacteraeota bacterium]|nr:polysaccharide deacetylase family protein [Candidatus Eremiobacteraeota bacterium]
MPARSGALAAAQGGVPVFTYHMVAWRIPNDPIGNALTITPQQLRTQLETLQRLGLHTMTAANLVAEIERGAGLPRRTVVLTFDDGYQNARTEVLPLLRRYHAVATFYLISSTIGTARHLRWSDVRALKSAGMEIGAHGREHVDLTELDATGQFAQVNACRRALRRWAMVEAQTYAYPSGRYNATTLAVMRRSGLAAAFTEDYGEVRSLSQPYRLPRIRVLRESAVPAFSAIAEAVRAGS